MQTKIIERYFFFGLLFATLLFSFLIFRPFWIVLVLGISFAIVLYPLFEWFTKKRIPNGLASVLTVIIFTLVLCGPILGIGLIIFNQSEGVYNYVVNSNGAAPILDKVETSVNQYLPSGLDIDLHQRTADFVSYVSKNIANIFSATISAFFSLILMLLIIFYFLKDGDKWRRAVIVLSPLADSDDEKIIHRLKIAVKGIITGNLLIALVQGILLGFGLWLFNVPNGALWGVVAAVCSLLPTFGTAFVSVPAIIYLLVTGDTPSAIGLAIWAGIVVGMIDNFLSPLLVGKKTNIPPLLILFAVIGGISLLGPVGVLVGPLTVSLLYTLISIYRHEFRSDEKTT
ncbi:MAG: AI-2E family transporter [Patescibacteria group bacterium]